MEKGNSHTYDSSGYTKSYSYQSEKSHPLIKEKKKETSSFPKIILFLGCMGMSFFMFIIGLIIVLFMFLEYDNTSRRAENLMSRTADIEEEEEVVMTIQNNTPPPPPPPPMPNVIEQLTVVEDDPIYVEPEVYEELDVYEDFDEYEESNISSTSSNKEKSTLELLEEINHASVVKQAKEAGVSTEGSTLDIMERINHASVVKQAKEAGVSTEGSTLDIMERINHASVVKQAKEAGVSTEGSTLDIMERINRASLQKQAERLRNY